MRRRHVLRQAEPAQRGADNANPTLLGRGQKSGELGRKHGGFSVLCSIRKKVLLLNLGHPFTCFRSGVVFFTSKDIQITDTNFLKYMKKNATTMRRDIVSSLHLSPSKMRANTLARTKSPSWPSGMPALTPNSSS